MRLKAVIADDAGNAYVLDEGASQIRVFDSTGAPRRVIGTRGAGPVDAHGRIWTAVLVPDPRWRAAEAAPPSGREGRAARALPASEWGKYLDTILEVIDPATARVIVSQRFPGVMGGFTRDGLLTEFRDIEDGLLQAAVSRPGVVQSRNGVRPPAYPPLIDSAPPSANRSRSGTSLIKRGDKHRGVVCEPAPSSGRAAQAGPTLFAAHRLRTTSVTPIFRPDRGERTVEFTDIYP